jgi:hypothetical protein
MRRSRNIARHLLSLMLTSVVLVSWNSPPVRSSCLVAHAATGAALFVPTGQPVSRAVANGKIAFVVFERDDNQIYTMNPDGSERTQLTVEEEYSVSPAWSPDGTKIAFTRGNTRDHRGQIFVMNADGGDQRRLTQSRNDNYPTWSPDGTKIAFSDYRIPENNVYVMNADGSDQRAIVRNNSQGQYSQPAWSPDGSKLAITGDDGIFLVNVDGSNRTQITQSIPFMDTDPVWSPDGSKIAFTRWTDCDFVDCYTPHLWIVNASGGNPTRLIDDIAFKLAWSPDGTKIIFANRDLFVMNADGSGITNVTNTNGKVEYEPSWQAVSSPQPQGPNPIEDAQFFIRQHYLDFLSREPDPDGLDFWTNEIMSCGGDTRCIEVKRTNVSAAFFLSIEFQNSGYLVERMYKAAYGDSTEASTRLVVPVVRHAELAADSAIVGRGVVVNSPGWERQLEANKQTYALAFVERQRFTDAYPAELSPAEFVAKLDRNVGGALTRDEEDALVAELSADGSAHARADVLRRVAENEAFADAEKNRAFVLMEYFGYLRRDPDSAPDANYTGYQFWLAKLDQSGGDYVRAEMVKAFINSTEYRERFGRP